MRPHLEFDGALRALRHRHLLLDLLRPAQRAGRLEVGDDLLARRVDVEPGVRARDIGELARRVDAEAEVEPVALPPLHVGAVAEGAHHHQAGAEVGADVLVGEDRHLVPADRNGRVPAREAGVPLVLGVEVERDATRDQLGAGGRDDEVTAIGARNAMSCSVEFRVIVSRSACASDVCIDGSQNTGSSER